MIGIFATTAFLGMVLNFNLRTMDIYNAVQNRREDKAEAAHIRQEDKDEVARVRQEDKDEVARVRQEDKDEVARVRQEDKDEAARNRRGGKKLVIRDNNKCNKEHSEYEHVRDLFIRSKDICGRWTSSNCDDPENMKTFIHMLAKKRNGYPINTPQKSFFTSTKTHEQRLDDDFKTIQDYRKKTTSFLRAKDYTVQRAYPGIGEFMDILTFHWAIDVGNLVCGYPSAHRITESMPSQLLFRHFKERVSAINCESDLIDVDNYRAQVEPEFVRTHNILFPQDKY